MPSKLHPFWYTPAAAVLLFRLGYRGRFGHDHFRVLAEPKAFGRHLELSVLVELGGALAGCILVECPAAIEDFFHRGMLGQIYSQLRSILPCFELALAFVIPITMLSFRKVSYRRTALYLASIFSLLGFITNRLNVCDHRLGDFVGTSLRSEVDRILHDPDDHRDGLRSVRLAVKYLPIFPEENAYSGAASPNRTQDRGCPQQY